jgi:hypothetical protein
MKKLYLFLGAGLLVPALLLLLNWQLSSGKPATTSSPSANGKEPQGNVGDIAFDPALDRPDFKPCHTQEGVQYYNTGTTYVGGTQALRRFFLQQTELPRSAASHHGYVTIRFLVNCRGETGRFRVMQIDTAYQPTQFAAPLIDALLSRTQSLRGWKPGTLTRPGMIQGYVPDSYYYLLFKIADGQVVDVMP